MEAGAQLFSAVSRAAQATTRTRCPAVRPLARPPSITDLALAALAQLSIGSSRGARPAARDRAAAPTRPLVRRPAAAGENCALPGFPRLLWQALVPVEQTRSPPVVERRRAPDRANQGMALSTPESDVELARRQREGVFVPPPHWKPRQEEVDLKKDYAFARSAMAASSIQSR